MKPQLSLLTLCLLLGACGSPAQRPDSGIPPPAAWQSPHTAGATRDNQQWWNRFGSPQLGRLIEQARVGSYDLAAAIARVRQAQAETVVAGGSQLPEVQAGRTPTARNCCAAMATANWMPTATTAPSTTSTPT